MLVDGILSVRLLCAEMRRQLRSWALCEAGSAESADYLVALHVYLRVCIVRRAFRDGQRGAAGRVLGFSVRTLCVLRALVTFGIWRRGTRKCHTMAAIPGFNGGNTSYCLRAGGRSILSGRGSAQVADW